MSEWLNYGDVNFGEWGGWLIRHDDGGLPTCYQGFMLAVPSDTGSGYMAQDAYVDVDDLDEDMAQRICSLYDTSGWPWCDAENADWSLSPSAAYERCRALPPEDLAFIMLDEGLVDSNRQWVSDTPWHRSECSLDMLVKHMESIGAGKFAPDTDDHEF